MFTLSRFSSPSCSARRSTSSTLRRRGWASLAKPALGAALAMGALTAGQAQALVVNVDGQDWDVTTFTGTIQANYSKFQTAVNGGVMPWWDDTSGLQAFQFATLVGLAFGLPNDPQNNHNARVGALFAIGVPGPLIHSYVFSSRDNRVVALASSPNRSNTFAQATPVSSPAPVPGPLPALGAIAALGLSRKLRNRIKGTAKEALENC